jgi:hypothetical protein
MKRKNVFLKFCLPSFVISLLLFYIDESRYSLDSILSIDNIISLLVLVILSSLTVTLLYRFLCKIWNEKKISLIYSMLIGYPMGFCIAFTVLVVISKIVV